MKKMIETSRLALRPMNENNDNDVCGVYDILSDDETAWWSDIYPLCTYNRTLLFIEMGNENGCGVTQLGIYERTTDKMVGLLQVHVSRYADLSAASLGCALSCEGRGKGYMTEAVQAVCDELFSDPTMTEVNLELLPTNKGSLGVARR